MNDAQYQQSLTQAEPIPRFRRMFRARVLLVIGELMAVGGLGIAVVAKAIADRAFSSRSSLPTLSVSNYSGYLFPHAHSSAATDIELWIGIVVALVGVVIVTAAVVAQHSRRAV